MSADYPSLRVTSKNLQNMFTIISDKMKAALDNDVFIPIFQKQLSSLRSIKDFTLTIHEFQECWCKVFILPTSILQRREALQKLHQLPGNRRRQNIEKLRNSSTAQSVLAVSNASFVSNWWRYESLHACSDASTSLACISRQEFHRKYQFVRAVRDNFRGSVGQEKSSVHVS